MRASVKKGIVPTILEVFLAERKRVKQQLQLATDPALRAVLNGGGSSGPGLLAPLRGCA